LRDIADAMAAEMAAGLEQPATSTDAAASAAPSSSLLMLPSAIDLLPSGEEAGDVFALEVGGSGTLRLLYARLSSSHRGGTDALELEEVRLDPALKHAPVEELFDALAARLAAFVRRCGWDVGARGPPVLGFCFSFPLAQTDRASGTLVRWTKGFTCPGGVGRDVGALLTEAAARAGLPLTLAVLVNDSGATLAAARYADGEDAVVALVLNAGTNAAYVELLSHIGKYYYYPGPAAAAAAAAVAGGGGGGGAPGGGGAGAAVVGRGGAVALGGGGGGGEAGGDAPTAAAPSPHPHPPHPGLPRTSDLVVNVEWRGFADALLPILPDDVAEGEGSEGEGEGDGEGGSGEGTPPPSSSDPSSSSCFERLTGPLYLGEATRRLLARLAAAGGWFEVGAAAAGDGRGPAADPAAAARAAAALASPGCMDFTHVCRAAADCTPDLRHVADELGSALGVPPASIPLSARPEIRDACAALLRRSARLTAAGLAGIIAHLASEGAARPDVSLPLDLDGEAAGGGGDGVAASVFGGYGPGGGATFDGADQQPTISSTSIPLPGPPSRRFIIAADGAMLRRGGRFVEELRAGLDDVLGESLASRVGVRLVDGGAALGAAALAAAAHGAAVAMGSVELGPEAGGRAYFAFPPRDRASTPLAPAAEEE